MPDFSVGLAIFIATVTLGVFLAASRFLERWLERVCFLGIIVCLFVWCGLGAAYATVPSQYLWTYFVFIAVMSAAFVTMLRLAGPFADKVYERTSDQIDQFGQNPVWVWVVLSIYLLASLVPLLYPEFRLEQLLDPPRPDLISAFERRFSEEPEGFLSKCLHYIKVLLYPFYLIAVYRYRYRPVVMAILMFLPLYFSYCISSYIGRGLVMCSFAIYILALWRFHPRIRKKLVLGVPLLLPLLMVSLFAYQSLRLGGEIQSITWQEACVSLIENEISFPLDAGIVIDSSERANMRDYVIWLVSLPIPKLLTGAIDGSRINYEISWILLGMEVGGGGYVRLTGLVTESIYIFGTSLFWLHAIHLGILAGLFCRIFEHVESLFLVNLNIAMVCSYHLTRGGISAAAPELINGHLALLAWLACLYCIRRTGAQVRPSTTGGTAVGYLSLSQNNSCPHLPAEFTRRQQKETTNV